MEFLLDGVAGLGGMVLTSLGFLAVCGIIALAIEGHRKVTGWGDTDRRTP